MVKAWAGELKAKFLGKENFFENWVTGSAFLRIAWKVFEGDWLEMRFFGAQL